MFTREAQYYRQPLLPDTKNAWLYFSYTPKQSNGRLADAITDMNCHIGWNSNGVFSRVFSLSVTRYVVHRETELFELLKQEPDMKYYPNCNDGTYFCSRDDADFPRLFQFLLNHKLIDDETKNSLLEDMQTPCGENEVEAEILKIAEIDILKAEEKAIFWAQKMHWCSGLWTLVKHHLKNNNHQEAINLLLQIPKDHKFSTHVREINQQLLTTHSQGIVILDAAEALKYRETLLLLSLEMKDTQFSTSLFFELAGNPKCCDYPEIKPDNKSLVAITREMSKLNREINQLRAQLSNQTLQTASLFKRSDEKNSEYGNKMPSGMKL